MRRLLPLLLVLLAACGSSGPQIPALTDDSTCEQARQVVDEAIAGAQAYIGTDSGDVALADELVFALSAVDERPECFEEDTIARAQGLRATLTGS